MAFFKTAVASLGLLLASSAYAQGYGTGKDFEDVLKASEIAAWEVASEKSPLISAEGKPVRDWSVESVDAGVSAEGSYALSDWITAGVDGSLSGHGLKLTLSDGQFYYDDLNVNSMFSSGNFPLSFGNKSIDSLMKDLERDADVLNREVESNLAYLESGLKEIYGDKYSVELFLGVLGSMSDVLPGYTEDGELTASEYSEFLGDMEVFLDGFYNDVASQDDKEKTDELLHNFVSSMRGINSTLMIEDLANKLYEDPLGQIAIGDRSLESFRPLFERLKPMLHFRQDDKGLSMNGSVEGAGHSRIDMETRYNLGSGEEFVRSFSSDMGASGRASMNFDARLFKGEPIYVYVTDDNIAVPLKRLGDLLGFHLHLLDVDISGSAEAGYRLHNLVSEGYQLSMPVEDGREGYGIVLDTGMVTSEYFSVETESKIDSHADIFRFSLSNSRAFSSESYENILLYWFREGESNDLWYHFSFGVSPRIREQLAFEDRQSLSFESKIEEVADVGFSGVKENSSLIIGADNGLHFTVMPQYSLAIGTKGKLVNPFLSYRSIEDELRVGMTVNAGPVISRFYLQSSDESRFSLETAVVLFDDKSHNKLESYYIRNGQIAASSRPGKLRQVSVAQSELYSSLSGLLLSGRVQDDRYIFRVVLGSENAYMGATYFGDFMKETQGIGVLFGYDSFYMMLEGGMFHKNNVISQQLSASIGGKALCFDVYLDLRGATWPLGKDAYDRRIRDSSWQLDNAVYYFEGDENFLGSLNVRAPFMEDKWLEAIGKLLEGS